MSSTQPYRMGMWESFMYRCGYVRRSKCEVIVKTDEDVKQDIKREARWLHGVKAAGTHFPEKILSTIETFKPVGTVRLCFTDGTKGELTGSDAKAILEAGG